MKRTALRSIVDAIVANKLYEDKDFFPQLDQELRKVGYRLVADQQGIRGTYIHIQPVEKP